MPHDVLPPDAGPWRRDPTTRAGSSTSGPWGYNPYAPPRDHAAQGAAKRSFAPEQLRLATPGQRLLAKIIDWILIVLALAPGIAVQLSWDTALGVGLWALGLLAIHVFQWAIVATSGQTLGKRWTGLRVVTEGGRRVGFLRGVVLREWVMGLGSTVASGVPLLLDPFFVFSKQHKTLHDHLAGTLVIVADTPGDPYQ